MNGNINTAAAGTGLLYLGAVARKFDKFDIDVLNKVAVTAMAHFKRNDGLALEVTMKHSLAPPELLTKQLALNTKSLNTLLEKALLETIFKHASLKLTKSQV